MHSGLRFLQWPSLFWQFEEFGAGKVFLLFADVAFGTGEGLLVYGMDARYRRGAPGVRDAFFRKPSVLKTGVSGTEGMFGTKNPLLRYGVQSIISEERCTGNSPPGGHKRKILAISARIYGYLVVYYLIEG